MILSLLAYPIFMGAYDDKTPAELAGLNERFGGLFRRSETPAQAWLYLDGLICCRPSIISAWLNVFMGAPSEPQTNETPMAPSGP